MAGEDPFAVNHLLLVQYLVTSSMTCSWTDSATDLDATLHGRFLIAHPQSLIRTFSASVAY